ncbi:hypothetical protein DYH10_03195 [Candidatus Saccharibacteria bacterium CPR2]|nr:hypothetical protein [Candidatus Saccharibacteria bacterium CPR2]
MKKIIIVLILLINVVVLVSLTYAQSPNPQSGSIGLEGTIPSEPPKVGATISIPSGGQSFSQNPITVSGICPNGLLVKIFKNEVFAGSTTCQNGSYSIQIDLFSGQNELVARVYDALSQPGPDSNKVTVTYDDGSRDDGLSQLIITTNYATRGANPNETLTWPIAISGGKAPYAISVDWGDGTVDLISREFAGEFEISHVYKEPGTYNVIIKITDANGKTAYLQLVAVANGPVDTTTTKQYEDKDLTTQTKIILWPMYLLIPLIPTAFYLGKRHELHSLKNRFK